MTSTTNDNNNNSESQQVRRKAFNWQFIGIEPVEDPKDDVFNWNVEQVTSWLKSIGLDPLAEISYFIE